MSPTRRTRLAILVPLATLSVASTLGICLGSQPETIGLTSATSTGMTTRAAPSATGVTTTVLPPPISAPAGGLAAPSLHTTMAPAGFGTATATIPDVALAAYQRAATVMDTADASCRLPWQLLAGIGRVESDHGHAQGNTLGADGIDTPGIYGPVLDGRHRTTRVNDTDGGVLDHDRHYDRAVGPMQFIPATWSQVAVDADGDGQRNPQDINDAALATAVYLCAGNADLATARGQRHAVFRYNHDWSYVHLVLAFAAEYENSSATVGLGPGSDTALPALATQPGTDAARPGHPSTPRRTDSPGTTTGTLAVDSPTRVTVATSNPTADGHPAASVSPAPSSSTPASPSSPSAPSDPSTPPAPSPATSAQLTDLCANGADGDDGIAQTYPSATTEALENAETYCLQQLTGTTLGDAENAFGDLLLQLPTLYPDLEPASTSSAAPSPDPGESPSPTGSPDASGSATQP